MIILIFLILAAIQGNSSERIIKGQIENKTNADLLNSYLMSYVDNEVNYPNFRIADLITLSVENDNYADLKQETAIFFKQFNLEERNTKVLIYKGNPQYVGAYTFRYGSFVDEPIFEIVKKSISAQIPNYYGTDVITILLYVEEKND